ncbi:c-type cytochrome [uncultured Chitinophaga sp.]|uniref:c-type cytochrome n=1 Tax=uncultured Chitinophaga sp. TaxID=339340 RepID=UPI0025D47E67|nr:c-type cytochrome [uncultured Chitinophaga sp.]
MTKKFLAPLFISAMFVAACGGGEKKEEKKDDEVKISANEVPAAPATPTVSKGETLIASKDCLTCHKVDLKLVGPAYIDVAKKYPATEENIAMLADKIIKGGTGNWGEVPMTPHPDVPLEDAKEMAKYILSTGK